MGVFLNSFLPCCFLFLCTSACVDEDVKLCPKVPDFSKFCGCFPDLGRRLQVACPCIGIHACGWATTSMGVPTDTVNIWDLEDGYHNALRKHLLDAGMQPHSILLNLGKKSGDLLNCALSQLKLPVDFIISGPPCPPWAGQGCKRGLNDKRSLVFLAILQWVFHLVKVGCLLGCILENVTGILSKHCGGEPAINKFLRILQHSCPEFTWRVQVLDALDYLLPQTRVRVFLVGVRKAICGIVPPALPRFGRRNLRDILGAYPITPRNSYTEPQQKNLAAFESAIHDLFQSGLDLIARYIHTYTYIYTYVYIYHSFILCTHTCIYVCVSQYVYIYVYVHIHSISTRRTAAP